MRDGQGSRGDRNRELGKWDPGVGEAGPEDWGDEPGRRGWWEPGSRGEGSARKGRGNRDKKRQGSGS